MPRVLAVLLIIAMGHRAGAQPAPSPLLADLVRTIDDDPDILHGDYTPAVWALCGRGLDGAEAILPLLEAPSDTTRMHAGTVLACAVARRGAMAARIASDEGWSGGGGATPR